MPRNTDPIIYPTSNLSCELHEKRKRNYDDSINTLQSQWIQADTDERFALGDQNLWGELYPGEINTSRKSFNFNIINSVIESIVGQQIDYRKSTVTIPLFNGLQKTSDQLTKCIYHVHDNPGTYQVYTDAFRHGALTQGIGFILVYRDLTNDPVSGDVRLKYVDFKSVLIDPYFRSKDLSDCRFIWTRNYFDREEACLIYPKLKNRIMEVGRFQKDDKFYYMPEVYQINSPNLIALDEYWYLSSRKATYILDTETNEVQEYSGDEDNLKYVLSHFDDRLKIVKRSKQTVRRQIIANNETLIDEPDPNKIDRYPYVPVLGYFNPNTPYTDFKYKGIVRDSRDAQFLFGRLKVGDLDIVDSQQQGLIIEQGSLVTPDDSFNAGHGRVLVRKKGSDPSAIQPMDIRPPSPILLEMEEKLQNLIYRIVGQDPGSMGIDVDDRAGIISMMRSAATARNLKTFFDNLDFSQQLVGNIIVGLIQNFYTFSKVQAIIGEEPTDEFDSKLFYKYGCKAVQAPLTESSKQLELAQLIEFQKMYPNRDISESILECMQIQNKEELLEKIRMQAEAQQQQQQQISQLQMQQMQVDNQTKLSYAESQQGLAAERKAKITTDMAIAQDKLRRSEQESTGSLLNLIKSIKELEEMDVTQLERKINILKSLSENKEDIENKAIFN